MISVQGCKVVAYTQLQVCLKRVCAAGLQQQADTFSCWASHGAPGQVVDAWPHAMCVQCAPVCAMPETLLQTVLEHDASLHNTQVGVLATELSGSLCEWCLYAQRQQ